MERRNRSIQTDRLTLSSVLPSFLPSFLSSFVSRVLLSHAPFLLPFPSLVNYFHSSSTGYAPSLFDQPRWLLHPSRCISFGMRRLQKKELQKGILQRKGRAKNSSNSSPPPLRAEKQLQAGVEKRQGAKTARESERGIGGGKGGGGGGGAGGNFPDKKARARDALTVTACIPGPRKKTHPFFHRLLLRAAT